MKIHWKKKLCKFYKNFENFKNINNLEAKFFFNKIKKLNSRLIMRTIPESFSQIRQKKWLWILMGFKYIKLTV